MTYRTMILGASLCLMTFNVACGDDTGDDDAADTSGTADGGTTQSATTGGATTVADTGSGGGTGNGSTGAADSTGAGPTTGGAESGDSGTTTIGATEDTGSDSGSGSGDSGSGDSDSGTTGGFSVEGCGMCETGEVCRANLSFQTEYECVAIPETCEGEANCGCAMSLCEAPYVACSDPAQDNSIECICIAC